MSYISFGSSPHVQGPERLKYGKTKMEKGRDGEAELQGQLTGSAFKFCRKQLQLSAPNEKHASNVDSASNSSQLFPF